MDYVLPSMVSLVLLNLVPFLVLRWYVSEWVAADKRRRTLLWIGIVFVILNLPLAVFFYRPLDALLFSFPTRMMETAFLPSFAWVATLLLYSLLRKL